VSCVRAAIRVEDDAEEAKLTGRTLYR